MGTKFANIHIQSEKVEDVLSSLKKLNNKKGKTKTEDLKTKYKFLSGDKKLSPELDAIFDMMSNSKNEYYLSQFGNGWISVYNEYFEREQVEKTGLQLSKLLKTTILTMSYFDDEIFEFNIFRDGKSIGGHIWSDESTKDTYKLETNKGDTDVFIQYIGEENKSKIINLFEIDNCERAVEEIERIFGLPIWMKFEWIEDIEDEHIRNRFIKYEI